MKNNVFFRIIKTSCCAFTALMLFIYLCIGIAGFAREKGIFPSMAFALFAVCMVITAVSHLFAMSGLHPLFKYLIHLFATLASLGILFRFFNYNLPGKTILVALVIIGILHGLIFTLIFMLKGITKKEKKYESIFKKD